MAVSRTVPPKKEFVRTHVPRSERISSVVILVLLAGVGAATYFKGQHFDANRFSLRPGALSSTSEEIEGKSATLRASTRVGPAGADPEFVETGDGYAEAGSPAAAHGEPLNVAVEGLTPLGDTEFYNAETLFEKIDGRAPAYLEFAFKMLRARSFAVAGEDGSFIDVLEFEMSSPVNAFGILSSERDEHGRPLDFADDGYASEMGYFLRRGPRYVQIIASDQNPRTMQRAEAVARDRVANLPGGDEGLATRRRLPANGLKPGTVEFIQSNAFGQAALHDVFKARYATPRGEVAFFVMVAEPGEADAAWNAYKEFSGKFGSVSETFESSGAKVFVAESFGNWIAVYVRGNEIGGVIESASAEAARGFVTARFEGSGVDRPTD